MAPFSQDPVADGHPERIRRSTKPSAASKRRRVVLADDHVVVIEGLRRILEPEFEIVDAVSDGRALLAAVKKLSPDVVVADITMPLLNGMEAARSIRKMDSRVRIIFLTMHPDVPYAVEALRAGGSGYVLKSSAGAELVAAIRQALRGRVFVTPVIAEPVMQALTAGPREQTGIAENLTARQREILQLIAEGRSTKEIAGILHVSPRTVEFHRYRLMKQLSLHSVAELTQFAIKHRILAP